MQVVEELRRGVRLKKHSTKRPSQVFEMTPYEILMADIRSRNYELRKVMVDGEVPPEVRIVKHDAHAVILDFIRSRPPLRKATERKLAPLRVQTTPHEQLLDEIRGGAQLRPPLPKREPVQHRRIITVDLSLFDDDDDDEENDQEMAQPLGKDETATISSLAPSSDRRQCRDATSHGSVACAAVGPAAAAVEVQRRSGSSGSGHPHRTSKRRHTIVGCQSYVSGADDLSDGDSLPSPFLKESNEPTAAAVTINPLNPLNAITQQALAEWTAMTLTDDENDDDDDGDDAMRGGVTHNGNQLPDHPANNALNSNGDLECDVDIPHATPAELPEHTSDRLTLSLEEIVHIRSVMTKAELEGLPVGVQVKEDVERRKVCFLCLRTRFSLFRQWGVQCKLCQRTVCTKCHTKMRIPTEHFRNVPVMLLSASLMGSPVTAIAPHESSADIVVGRSSARLMGRQHITAGSAPTTPRMYRNGGTGAAPNYMMHHQQQQQQQHRGSTASALAASSSSSSTAAAATEATVRGAAHVLARHHHYQHNHNDMSLMSRSMDADALMTSGSCGVAGSNGAIVRNLPPQTPRSHPNTLDRQQTRFGFRRSPTRVRIYECVYIVQV